MAAAGMVIGLGAGIIGGVMQIDAAQRAAKAQEAELRLQQQAENVKETAARLDAQRRIREQVREQVYINANAESASVNQGVNYGTILPGSQYGTTAQTAQNVNSIQNQLTTARDIFALNRNILEYKKEEARAGAESALGAGISSIGGAIGKSLGSIGRLS